MELTAETLIAACADDSFDDGITITAELEPMAGVGTPVKPAIYAGGKYQTDTRWAPSAEGPRKTSVIVIDNVPSQANRLEAALGQFRDRLGLPEIVLDLSGIKTLPVHLPHRISSFQFPHRNADAYLRDAVVDGVDFMKSPIGKEIFSATADDPDALFEWLPQALLFGFWQSHLGKKLPQTKLARSWVSEIVGFNPASTDTHTAGVKGDPLNLSIDRAVNSDGDDRREWGLDSKATDEGKLKKEKKLAAIGHGQVPFDEETLAAVSFERIEQRSTVSFASLRRVNCASPEASSAGRALLVAIGLAAHVGAFGRSFSLRSGAELRETQRAWTWLSPRGDQTIDAPNFDEVARLVGACASAAEGAGLPVGSKWAAPIVVMPNNALTKVIEETWPIDLSA